MNPQLLEALMEAFHQIIEAMDPQQALELLDQIEVEIHTNRKLIKAKMGETDDG